MFVIPKDLPSTIAARCRSSAPQNKMGIKSDAEFGISGARPAARVHAGRASDEVERARTMRDDARLLGHGLDAQGGGRRDVDTAQDLGLLVQCYDKRLISEGGAAVEGSVRVAERPPAWRTAPVSNPMLDAFIKYNKKPDGFGPRRSRRA